MATLIEYFNTDLNQTLTIHKPWLIKDVQGKELPSIIARVHLNFNANAKYWSFYIPPEVDIETYVNTVFQMEETKNCVLGPEGDGASVETEFAGYPERMSSFTLLFTNRIFLYIDAPLSGEERDNIKSLGETAGFYAVVRDQEYAMTRSEQEKPMAFIAHDSRDKDDIVRDLAIHLTKLMCPVWYDEYSLEVGDSLRQSIEKGLKETRNCIIILSPNFLSNEGWGKAEFDSIYTREILEKQNVMLPIWHNVTTKQVYDYSPRLADKVGLVSSIGVEEIARKLARIIKRGDT